MPVNPFGMPVKLTIFDRNQETCEAFRWQFRQTDVEIVHGLFEDLSSYDCIITAGNSFGLMDAGIDLAVVKTFGTTLMERIQQTIIGDFLGEQPVGTCILLPTGHPAHPFVAHAPTMRVPMNIAGTDNVYQAMWASFIAIHRHNRDHGPEIQSVVCPGLGTGTGGVDPLEAATQMHAAYSHFMAPPVYLNGTYAQKVHERVHYGGRWGFQHPRFPV